MIEVGKFETAEDAVDYALWVLAHADKSCGKRAAAREGFALNPSAENTWSEPLVVFDIDATIVTRESKPIAATIKLLKRLRKARARIHLVTARHPSIRQETIDELISVGITPDLYDSLMITPEADRKHMGAVGKWKENARRSIALQENSLIVLTIGDQWTDLVVVSSAEEMAELDSAFIGFGYCPKYVLVRPKDGISCLGLKLAYEEKN